MSQAPTVVTIAVDLMQLLIAVGTLVGFFLTIVFVFGRLLLRQFELRLGERFAARDSTLADIKRQVDQAERHGRNVEADMLRLRAELPEQYVRREDWIRFSGTIDAKLDWLREKCEVSARGVAQLVERMKKGQRGDGDGG